MMSILKHVLKISILCALATAVYGEDLALEKRVVEHTFPNGIHLLVLERHFSPTVAIRMMFRTGSVDEVSGKTGLAHMFEHMMFKGTRTLGTKNYTAEAPLLAKINALHRQLDDEKTKGARADQTRISELIQEIRSVEEKESALIVPNELWNLYEREGASDLNASTSHDFTQYQVDLPSNKFLLWAVLDSDRLKYPVFRQFYQEREVVKEERRMRVDTNPAGKLFENFLASAYQSHPYRHPTIGWESDLDHLHVEDLEDFYHRYYTPDALTIAVVGDVKAADVISTVGHYFGSWKIPPTTRSAIAPEPPQPGMRRLIVKFEAQPRIIMGFHIAAYPDPDYIPSYAVAGLLGSGTTSRLYKALVEKKKIASSVETGQDFPGERYDSLFIISADPRFPHTTAEIEKAVWTELDKLKKEPIAEWEMEKIRSAVNVNLLSNLQTNNGMASTLAYDQSIFGDWRYLLQFQKAINELTPANLQNVARKIFVKDNETVAVLEPARKP